MNKSEWIAAAAQNAGVSKKDAERTLNAALELIGTALSAGDRVQISGFGSFEVKQRSARVGRNPLTGETVEIPPAQVPVFKPSQGFKEKVEK